MDQIDMHAGAGVCLRSVPVGDREVLGQIYSQQGLVIERCVYSVGSKKNRLDQYKGVT